MNVDKSERRLRTSPIRCRDTWEAYGAEGSKPKSGQPIGPTVLATFAPFEVATQYGL